MIKKKSLIVSVLCVLTGLIAIPVIHYEYRQEQARTQELEKAKSQVITAQEERPVNLEHVRCLALNIYHEAGSEPFMGQVAVARVVMNRVRHGFASNPCKVIYQSSWVPDKNDPEEAPRKVCQFSWVCEGKPEPHRSNPRYQQAETIAHEVLRYNRWHDHIPSNVVFFHNTSVDPGWVYKRAMTIGNHVFYTRQRDPNIRAVKHTE